MGVTGRIYRWREIRIQEHCSTTKAILELVGHYFDWSMPESVQYREIAPQDIVVTNSAGFDEETRLDLLQRLKEAFPSAKFGFYGHQAMTVLDAAVALDEFIQ